MKAHLAHVVLPRGAAAGARRKLSNVAAQAVLIPQSSHSIHCSGSISSSSPSAVLLYDLPMTTSGSGAPGPSSGGGGGGARLPQPGKSTVQSSLSLTTYIPPPPSNSQSQQSSQNQTYARFTAPWTSYNTSLSYNNSIPPAVLPQSLPQQRFSPRSSAAEKEDEDESASGSIVPGYSLEIGAYGIPKRRSARNDDGAGSGSSSQNYDLAVQVGEDAYFLREDALGVADGVGGWKHKDKEKRLGGANGNGNGKDTAIESNSALFARKLMHYCSWELAEFHKKNKKSPPTTKVATTSNPPPAAKSTAPVSPSASSSTPSPDPISILQTSYDRCLLESQQSNILGSSTALLAILVDTELRIAHLGDCAVCLIRDGEMAFRSEEMQHSFNYPFQLGPRSASTPTKDAKRFTVEVKPDDILILASDGMGDNLWDEDVVDEVGRYLRHLKQRTSLGEERRQPRGSVSNAVMAQRLSEALASRAKRVSERRAGDESRSGASTADPGSTGVFRSKESKQTSPYLRQPTPMVASISTPPATQQLPPTPPPTPKLTTKESINYHPGDGFGGDGEYGGAGRNAWWGDEEGEEDEEEWVADETPFGRKAKESGLRFVGGKEDDISVLVAIISGSSTPPTPSPNPVSATLPPKLTMTGSSWVPRPFDS